VRKGVSGITAGGAWIERELGGAIVAAVAEDIFPGTVVRRAERFRAEAGGVVEELFDRDFFFAGIAEGLGPGDELEGGVVEGHFFGREAALALIGRDGEDGGADRFGDGGDAARIGDGAVAALDFKDDVTAADDDGGEVARVGIEEPLAEIVKLCGVDAGEVLEIVG